MAKEEHVLVVERTVLEQSGLFQGITFDVKRLLDAIFVAGVPRFMPRSQVEQDPTYKQLIPYVVMVCGGKYLSYVRGRRAGETRLVGRRSIGIGGHINPGDENPLFNSDFRDAYRTAVEREVAEEVCVDTGHTDNVVALLNDDSTDVGRVHLGIVHLWELDAASVTKREQMITDLAFMTPMELADRRETLENWSQLCLDDIETFTEKVSAAREASPSAGARNLRSDRNANSKPGPQSGS